MKLLCIIISFILIMFAEAQNLEKLPAMLEAKNGAKARVFLKKITANTLLFSGASSSEDKSIPLERIASLTFLPDESLSTIEKKIKENNKIEPDLENLITPYESYMTIPNNLQLLYTYQMCNWWLDGKKSLLENACNKLIVCDDENIQTYGLRYSLLLALENNDLLKAEDLIDSLDDSVMKKYFEAEFISMKLGPKHGMNQGTDFILKNANDIDWLAPIELLSAKLYLEMGMTNSAVQTARQVSSIYKGTVIACEALKMIDILGVDLH